MNPTRAPLLSLMLHKPSRAFIYVIDKLLIPTETDGPDGSEKTAHKQLMDVHREHQRKSFVRGRVLEHLRLKYEAAVARQDATAQYSISMNIADTHMKQDQPSEAREWLMNSLDLAIKRGLPPTSLLGAVRSLARLHQQTGKHTDAVQQGRVLLCSAVKAGDVHFEGEACHLLAVSYAALGEREQATRMDARYLRLALHGATLEEQAQVLPRAPPSCRRRHVFLDRCRCTYAMFSSANVSKCRGKLPKRIEYERSRRFRGYTSSARRGPGVK